MSTGRRVLTSLALVLASGAALADSVVFLDGFESYSSGSILNWTPPVSSPWTLSNGTIDLIHTGNYALSASAGLDLLNGQSFFLDMDGSTHQAGLLDLHNILTPGQQYQLDFIVSGNQRGNIGYTTSDTVDVALLQGSTAISLVNTTLAHNAPWQIQNATFTYQSGDIIRFRDLGSTDNVGYLLDNVRISAVPEPISMVMLGFLGAGMLGVRKLKGKKQ
ncbi:MAG: PEP-CTERM sorting domain-containing protein [Candidatus Hydrogenedentes bacterium]|nr:PEP-CTERM sorting domain-containing protein [Candidatus Hydrogenedentota bacterium]